MNLNQQIKVAQKKRDKWINFAPYLTDKGKIGIKTGTVLGFKQDDGSMVHYKFVQLNRKSDKYYAIELGHLYDQAEIDELTKEEAKKAKKKLNDKGTHNG